MKRLACLILALALAAALCPAALAEEDAEAAEPMIVDPYRLYTYEQMLADLDALAARYPELVSVSSIGQSVRGRDIPLLSLGKGDRIILICAAMHAREFETTNYVMYTAERYCRAYEGYEWYYGLDCHALLEGVRFLVVPMLNPDGVEIAQKGTEFALADPALAAMPVVDGWAGNYYCWKANANGVDLNHNWPYLFNNTYRARYPASANYAGPEPLSEPESQAMNALAEQTPFYAFCSFHSAGDCVYWIDSSNSRELREKLYPVANRIAQFCGYYLKPNEDVSRIGGYMINHFRAATEKPCITVELGRYKGRYPFQNYDALREINERAYPIGLLLADEVLRMPEDPAAAAFAAEAKAAAEALTVHVTLDGAEIAFPDAQPVIENDRVLTPLRAVCEAAGLSVGWDDGAITVTDGICAVELTVGVPAICVDGAETALDCAPVLRDDRALIPIRAVMEPFGFLVDWDGEARTVVIASAQTEEQP